MDECVFCKIINKEKDNMVFFENDHVIAMLDSNPVVQGHSLVIPKKHSRNNLDIEESSLIEVIKAVKLIASTMMKKLNANGFNIISANEESAQQTVFHTHYHIIPRFDNDGMDLGFHIEKASIEKQKEIYELMRMI
jgi:histidine triad (HIT) family protein